MPTKNTKHGIESCVRTEGLVLNVPDWFEDAEFTEWLNSPRTTVMTWHPKGELPNEWSDVLVLVDPSLDGDGTDSDMPERFWNAIVDACREARVGGQPSPIPVRLTNLVV